MNYMNRVVLMGYLDSAPVKELNNRGKATVTFNMSTEEHIRTPSGERKTKVEHHKIVTWGSTSEQCERLLKKGSLVLVEGRIKNQPNNNSYIILANEVSFIANYGGNE